MKHIPTNRNCDRYAACELDKPRKEKAPQPKSKVKVYKAPELYSQEYGKEAYEAWVARDAQIKELSKDVRKWSKSAIVNLYRQSFLLLKERSAQSEVVVDEHGKIIIAKPACLPPMKAACDRLVA